MEELGDKECRTISEQAKLEEWWQATSDQESYIRSMEGHHNKLRQLHDRTWHKYQVMRAEFIKLHSEVTQHKEQNREWADSIVQAVGRKRR